MASNSVDRGRRNLDFLHTAVDEYPPEKRTQLAHFLVGWVSGFVPESEWAQGVASGVKMLEESR